MTALKELGKIGHKMDKLFKRDEKIFILQALLRANTIQESIFKLFALEKIVEKAVPGKLFSRDEILIPMEEFPYMLTQSDMLNLILSTGLFAEDGDRYRTREKVMLEQMQGESKLWFPKSLKKIQITFNQIRDLIKKRGTVQVSRSMPLLIGDIKTAIFKGLKWLHWTLHFSQDPVQNLQGLPAFWICQDVDGDMPMGFLQAGTSNGDTIGTMADSFFHHCRYPDIEFEDGIIKPEVIAETFDIGLEYILDCQLILGRPGFKKYERNELGHNLGGFLPHDDQPLAFHPTVDATWDALIALNTIHDVYRYLEEMRATPKTKKETVLNAVVSGVDFLIRMQLDEGGWGIYKYPKENKAPVFAHEFTTGLVILSLYLSILSGALDDEPDRLNKTHDALFKSFLFLKDQIKSFKGINVYTPFFTMPVNECSNTDILKASVLTVTGLLTLYRWYDGFIIGTRLEQKYNPAGGFRETIIRFLAEFIRLAEKHWETDYRKFASVDFKVPLETRLNDTFNSWENRLDTTMAIMLLDLFNESCKPGSELDIKFSDSLWERIQENVLNILNEQHPNHGHWNEPVGGKPLAAAATMMALQALHYYLTAMKNMLG